MEIDAIGSVLNEQASLNAGATSLGQEEFLRLFLTELNFQDPMEPIDNREFLAQIAEFSSLEQERNILNELENLVFLNSSSQSVGLLNKEVVVTTQSGDVFGEVEAIAFSSDGANLTIRSSTGEFLTGIRLSNVRLIR